MTEQAKREPKDGEWWWCQVLFEKELHCILRISGSAMEGLIWDTNGEYYNVDIHPIAIVASHELMTELVETLRYITSDNSATDPCLFYDEAIKLARAALAKARAAGLGE